MNPLPWIASILIAAIPPAPVKSVCEWGRTSVRLVGSARSEKYNPDITPWTKEPLERCNDGTRICTVILPIQSGKSVIGEIANCFWLSNWNGGDVQYNWQNDEQADARWEKRVEKIFKSCGKLMARTDPDRFKWKKGLVILPHCNFTMQGVNTPRNVASDSIRGQINEEIHDIESGWEEGKLAQCYGRTTAFWNSVIFNISNAGKKGGQLHKAFLTGTQQHWEVKCPGCGEFHRMRTRWEDSTPKLGGLRYNADECRDEAGKINYNKLKPTIRFQMPCGFEVKDDLTDRRALSLSGRYSVGDNPGAPLTERSYTMEAVSVDYIPWIDLIKQKHEALMAMKWGDSKPWWDYLRERECQFSSDEERPIVRKMILSPKKKDRAGMEGRIARVAGVDYQHGDTKEGEAPHFWHVIADVGIFENKLKVLIVSEGKELSEGNLIDTLNRHEVQPSLVAIDSGHAAKYIYNICMKNGYYALKGASGTEFFTHQPSGARKIFSQPKPLHPMASCDPMFPYVTLADQSQAPNAHEPMFILYSSFGLMDRVRWLRTSPDVTLEIPGDVSPDFISHMEAWEMQRKPQAKTQQMQDVWVQVRKRDDLFKCFCYIALLLEEGGFTGTAVEETKQPQSET